MGTCSPKMYIKAGNLKRVLKFENGCQKLEKGVKNLKRDVQNLKKARNWDFYGQN